MSCLHLFAPENDLALAKNLEHYTPPPAASQLKTAGECLPLWYGSDGDRFVASGVNARWLEQVHTAFGMDINPFDYQSFGLAPSPWGWSKATRFDFKTLGYPPESLPTDAQLDTMRLLAHRRTALEVAHRWLGSPVGSELRTPQELEAYLVLCDSAIFKLPYSSSGRGLVPYDRSEYSRKLPQLLGMIRQQGSVIAEPRYHKNSDFALLYEMRGGTAVFHGYSLFTTASTGAYTGNILMPQQAIRDKLAGEYDGDFDAVPSQIALAMEAVIGTGYEGPLGVDMLTLKDCPAQLALCEINLRNTMGHVCLHLYERYVEPGRRGRFEILPRAARADRGAVADGRMGPGVHYLNPPGNFFDFTVTIFKKS